MEKDEEQDRFNMGQDQLRNHHFLLLWLLLLPGSDLQTKGHLVIRAEPLSLSRPPPTPSDLWMQGVASGEDGFLDHFSLTPETYLDHQLPGFGSTDK